MKATIRILVILFLTIILSSGWDMRPDDFFISTIYTVAGIIFSVGLSLIVTFSLHGIKNKSYITRIRKNLYDIRFSFIGNFIIATIAYIFNNYIGSAFYTRTVLNIEIKFAFSILFSLMIFYAIAYFIVNMLAIQKLNNDLLDKINEEC